MSLGLQGQREVPAHFEGVRGVRGQCGVLTGLRRMGVTTWGDPLWVYGQGLSLHIAVCGDMGRSWVLLHGGGHMECPHV